MKIEIILAIFLNGVLTIHWQDFGWGYFWVTVVIYSNSNQLEDHKAFLEPEYQQLLSEDDHFSGEVPQQKLHGPAFSFAKNIFMESPKSSSV